MLRAGVALLVIASVAGCSYPHLVREDGTVDDAYLQRIAAGTSAACDIELTKPIDYQALTHEQAKAKLAQVLATEVTREEWKTSELVLRAFGFLDGPTGLEAQVEALHGEQALGFYLSREKKYFIVADHPGLGGASLAMASWALDRDLAAELVTSHELVHALQDRRHDLEKYLGAPKANDDEKLARKAVVEGHATWFGLKYLGHGLERKVELTSESVGTSGEALERAPPVLRETLTFPYWGGFGFMKAIGKGRDPWTDAPRSTEQVLHPEKYHPTPEEPIAVTLGPVKLPEGWRLVDENTVGELQTRALFLGAEATRELAVAAAEGWGGDRYTVHEHPATGALALAWALAFDTPRDALEFVRAYRAFRRAKGERDAALCVLTGPASVAVVEAPDGTTSKLLAPAALQATFGEPRKD